MAMQFITAELVGSLAAPCIH